MDLSPIVLLTRLEWNLYFKIDFLELSECESIIII